MEHSLRETPSTQNETLEEAEKRAEKPKDNWDKLTASAPFVTGVAGVLIAVLGLYFTHSFNKRQAESNQLQASRDQDFRIQQSDRDDNLKKNQVKLAEIQTVGTFMPYLTGSESNKKVAILMIRQLTNDDLTGNIISSLGGEGSIKAAETLIVTSQKKDTKAVSEALVTLATNGKPDDQRLANETVEKVFSGYIFEGTPGERIKVEVVSEKVGKYFAAALDGTALSEPFTFILDQAKGRSKFLRMEFSFPDDPKDAQYRIKITGSSGTLNKVVKETDVMHEITFVFKTS
jgi:hypothetical protein